VEEERVSLRKPVEIKMRGANVLEKKTRENEGKIVEIMEK
jgi:hypothetical protein